MVNLRVNSPPIPSASITNIFKTCLANSTLWTEVFLAKAYHVCSARACKAALDWNRVWIPPSCWSHLYQRALVWVRIQKLSSGPLKQNHSARVVYWLSALWSLLALLTFLCKQEELKMRMLPWALQIQKERARHGVGCEPEGWRLSPPLPSVWGSALPLKSPCSSVRRRLCYCLRGRDCPCSEGSVGLIKSAREEHRVTVVGFWKLRLWEKYHLSWEVQYVYTCWQYHWYRTLHSFLVQEINCLCISCIFKPWNDCRFLNMISSLGWIVLLPQLRCL